VNGELTYKVAGAHHLADGVTLFKGSYDLVLRTEFARCLYGFSNAPISAKVSVVSTDGSTQDIATESLREDAARQWLYLSAKNFTFSAPTIKVKLIQDKPLETIEAEPAKVETAKAPATAAVKKVITVTCTKGKITKKFSGANPHNKHEHCASKHIRTAGLDVAPIAASPFTESEEAVSC
jgi:hypothetical protein